MEIVFLGTNGWYDTNTGNTICILIKTKKFYIILDAGNGLHKTDNYCRIKKPAYLFLSHFHLDHIIGFHTLNKIRCFKALHIFGPSGSKKILKYFIDSPFTMPLPHLPYPVEIHELPREQKILPFPVDARPLLHSSLTLGFRIEIDGRVISYCPDTGYCRNAVLLSKNADLLIAECAYKSGQNSTKWPHLNPEAGAKIAKEAQVKKLALVHFDASIYRSLADRKEAERKAQKIFRNTVAVTDDMRIKFESS